AARSSGTLRPPSGGGTRSHSSLACLRSPLGRYLSGLMPRARHSAATSSDGERSTYSPQPSSTVTTSGCPGGGSGSSTLTPMLLGSTGRCLLPGSVPSSASCSRSSPTSSSSSSSDSVAASDSAAETGTRKPVRYQRSGGNRS